MRKFLFSLMFVAMAIVGQAQLYVGGTVGFGRTGGKTDTTLDGKTQTTYDARKSSFQISPNVGYMLSDVIGIGIDFSLLRETDKTCPDPSNGKYDNKTIQNTFVVAPYLRYVLADFGKIDIYADAKIPLEFSGGKNVFVHENVKTEAKLPKGFGIGVSIVPGISYSFNEHLSINTEIGLLGIDYMFKKVTDTSVKDVKKVTKTNEFGIGINSRVAAKFGFVYTF